MPASQNDVIKAIEGLTQKFLEVYRVDPGQVREHANLERSITQGGYGERQIYELVQNGADENLRDTRRCESSLSTIHVLLTDTHLYCANTGTPISADGAETILRMASSKKRAGQIGRFGVGVKSVLTVSDTPRFYSTNGSFGFDKQRSDRDIRAAVPSHPAREAVPVLRLAHPLDLTQDRAADPLLDDLMQWASTTVVLPLIPGSAARLGRDLTAFPSHFMLFSSHVDRLILEDIRPGSGLRREISQLTEGSEHWIAEQRNGKPRSNERWFVFSVEHEPSPVAAATAGEQHDRPVITVSWAVPDKGVAQRTTRGAFWAYFPTHYDTTLTGIINAPWKTPEDRQNLTKSVFNDELVSVAARLIVASIPSLLDDQDPSSYLNLLTARGREASQWGDAMLSSEVLRVAAKSRSLPDQDGVLQLPESLLLHPEGLTTEWLNRWAGHPGRPRNWCHHSVEHRERRSRARDILAQAGVEPARLKDWLEALVADRTVEGAKCALLLAADVVRSGNAQQTAEARSARILLADGGRLHAASEGVVFRRQDGVRVPNDSTVYLYDRLAADFELLGALNTLGIQEANSVGRFRAAVAAGFARYRDEQHWEAFWALARKVTAEEVAAIVAEKNPDPRRVVKVRTAAGRFRPLRDCFLAGPVVPADGGRDAGLLVDRVFHAEDMETLKALGATDRPVRGEDPREDPWFEEYCEVMYAALCAALPAYSSRPRRSSVAVTGAPVPGPLHVLRELSPEGRAAFARELPEGGVPLWTVQRTTGQYESIKVESPLIWMLAKEGRLLTSLGVRRVRDSVAQELDVHSALLPVADLPTGTARALDLPAALPEVPEGLWTELLQRADAGSDSAFVGAAYAFLAEAAPAGTLGGRERTFRCRRGESWTSLPAASIAVTFSWDEHELLLRERVPALLVPNESAAQLLVGECGFSWPGTLLTEEVHSVPLTDPVPLTDFFPRLRQRFPESTAWKLAYCSELIKIVSTPDGPREEPLTEAVDGVTVLLCGEHDEESMLAAVDRQLVLRLGLDGRRSLLRLQERDANDRKLQQVREESDLAAKLVLAVGASRLLAALPPGLETADSQLRGATVDGRRAAELLIAAHGENILQVLAPALLEAEFDVPRQWTGTLRAREFVRSFRFPEAWAGDPETPASAAPYETVPGPRKALVLHDYQRALVEKIYEHLAKGEDMRAMIQIPTGSGKTRIAAEAGVRAIRDGVIRGPILWITQSRELAEQAIETWSYVWQVEGADQPLRITRMWGGMPDAVPVKDGPQVVVAIDDTAVVRLPKEGYAWLRDCALVIVDEAHFAVPKTYTSILDQLGIDRHGAARPLLGLTATAFRGDSDEETGTLVARFGRKRLDYGVFENDDAYGYLQSIGVLARVEPEELLGGSYSLSEEQVSAMKGTEGMALPADAMRGLERDVERTRRIVQRILSLDPDWPVLVFATSVEHAQVLAALLNDRGRPAASIDGKTPPNIRRNRVAAFKEGRIRVLTNYKVLTQGFDAPAVRAVVVARPTFSPNTYIQMIGRGLRGELNGGKDSCLILNVKDNIENFGRDLAYTRMEYLWRGERS